MTRVIHLPSGSDMFFSLPPDKAVVAAFERQMGNHDTWNYVPPSSHPEYRRGNWGHHCGDFSARA